MDFPDNPPERPAYVLEFADDSRAASLNRDKWLPYYLPHWSSRARTAARFSLPGDRLLLHLEKDQDPWCPEFDGEIRVSALQTGCFSGPVGSGIGQLHFRPDLVVSEAQPAVRLYTPLYGYFEIRLKAIPIPGYMVALWMMGFEERPEHSGEICICEIFGHEMTAGSAQINYGLHPFGDPNISDEFYYERMPINAAEYHIYAAEWTPAQVTFFVDNRKTRAVEQSPGYLMQFMLAVYEIPQHLTPEARATPWPKTFAVDYVRGYRPAIHFLAPAP